MIGVFCRDSTHVERVDFRKGAHKARHRETMGRSELKPAAQPTIWRGLWGRSAHEVKLITP